MSCTIPSNNTPPVGTFANACSVNFCVSTPATANWIWTGTEGEVTRPEFESALEMAYSQVAVTAINNGNGLAYGSPALASAGASLLYDFSGDKRALDVMVRWADNVLALRNDNTTGEVLWNGIREPVWPTTALTAAVQGAGSEQGMIIGHMVNAAVAILQTPCVYDLIPPVQSGYPTPFNRSTTYYQRAIQYIQAGDEAFDQYLIPYFVYAPDLLFRQPNDTRWNLGGAAADPAGELMAFNRRMLLIHGLLALANAHALLPVPDETRIAQEDEIIKANMLDFIKSLNSTTSASGTPTYIWYYPPTVEESGLHGLWDIWVTFLAWQRNPTLYGTTTTVMTGLGNTMIDTIYHPTNGTFSAYVDGRVTTSDYPRLPGIWAFYSNWRAEWFDIVATAAWKNSFQVSDMALYWLKHVINA